ncbi:MAG: DUF6265 family protein [Terriglobales bacterium]
MRIPTASLLLFLLPACFAQEKMAKPVQNVGLADFAFISGHSRGEFDGGIADEHWSEAAGDSMMGMYRFILNGKVQMYELLVIEQTAKGPVLRLRYFDPGLVAREDKAQVWSYLLIHFVPGEAVFERSDKGARITYRTLGHGVLESRVERAGKKPEVFQYTHSAD